MKILVTGVNGQLGYDISKALKDDDYIIFAPNRMQFDLTNEEQVKSYLEENEIETIIHCAAYTAVDNAETDKINAYNVNVNGTTYIVNYAKENDIPVIYFSTDYVFNGKGNTPFIENDKKSPINYYGETKSLGEDVILNNLKKFFIIRISWVFGENGNNFVKTMIRLSKEKSKLSIINDQIGSPTYAYDVAQFIKSLILSNKYGIYHVTNEGYCSWYEFANKIFELINKQIETEAIASDQYETKAKRPLNSRLNKNKLVESGFTRLRPWDKALEHYILKLKEKGEV